MINMRKTATLAPIHNPVFNERLIVKQMLLLEEHLNQPNMHCFDCIRKHFLMIEALAEEAIQLDGKQEKAGKYVDLTAWIMDLGSRWNKVRHTHAFQTFAQEIRTKRKAMMTDAFELECNTKKQPKTTQKPDHAKKTATGKKKI